MTLSSLEIQLLFGVGGGGDGGMGFYFFISEIDRVGAADQLHPPLLAFAASAF